jgi:membrane protein implicated in regulation of membrane protease activity
VTWRAILAVPVLAAALIAAAPMALLAGALLLPSVLAWAGEPASGRHILRAVLLFGIAAASPSLIALWSTGHRMDDAIALATDPRSLALCWSVQAGGWLLGQIMSVLLAIGLQRKADRQQQELHARRAALEQEWH